MSDAYVACVGLFGTYFETNGHFDSNVKLFPVIYANYRPMTDAKRKPWEILDRISWPPKHEKKNGNVWETFGNSILLL